MCDAGTHDAFVLHPETAGGIRSDQFNANVDLEADLWVPFHEVYFLPFFCGMHVKTAACMAETHRYDIWPAAAAIA